MSSIKLRAMMACGEGREWGRQARGDPGVGCLTVGNRRRHLAHRRRIRPTPRELADDDFFCSDETTCCVCLYLDDVHPRRNLMAGVGDSTPSHAGSRSRLRLVEEPFHGKPFQTKDPQTDEHRSARQVIAQIHSFGKGVRHWLQCSASKRGARRRYWAGRGHRPRTEPQTQPGWLASGPRPLHGETRITAWLVLNLAEHVPLERARNDLLDSRVRPAASAEQPMLNSKHNSADAHGIVGRGTTEIAAVENAGKLTGTQDGTPCGIHDSVQFLPTRWCPPPPWGVQSRHASASDTRAGVETGALVIPGAVITCRPACG